MLDLLADVGAPPRAQATGRMLGTSQPEARCQLVLFDTALAVVVKAKHGASTTLHISFDQLASFQPDVRTSGERAYQAGWGPGLPTDSSDELLDELRQSLAFAVEKTRRGERFAVLLEAAVRAQRPDLPPGRDTTDTDRAGQPRMEPSDLWAPFGPQDLAASSPPRRATACDRLSGVIAEVYRRAAGKPQERVRAVLEHELQAADLHVSWPTPTRPSVAWPPPIQDRSSACWLPHAGPTADTTKPVLLPSGSPREHSTRCRTGWMPSWID